MTAFHCKKKPQAGESLTEHEKQVLVYLAKGFRVKEIGSLLDRSPHTVADHLKHIYRKLDVSTNVEAAIEAYKMGLVA